MRARGMVTVILLCIVTLSGFACGGGGTQGKIAFGSDRDGNWEIYVMDADGSHQTNLTNNPGADRFPSWSTDGSKIAFESNRDGNWEVYVMDADGSHQINLTNNRADDRHPSWSPDGSKIAFSSDRDGVQHEIYAMDADGSNQTRLTNNTIWDHFPSWLPPGSKIAFTSNRDFDHEVYVMDADGSNQINLSNNRALDPSLAGLDDDNYPEWSLDGTEIAFASNRDGNWEIYVMDADGSHQINLTNNPADEWAPSWSPQ